MHSFQNFIVKLIPNHPPPLETRIWKLVVRALLSGEESSSSPVLPTLGFYPKILGFFWDIGIFLGFLF